MLADLRARCAGGVFDRHGPVRSLAFSLITFFVLFVYDEIRKLAIRRAPNNAVVKAFTW